MSFAEAIAAALLVKAHVSDCTPQSKFFFKSSINCPVVDLQEVLADYLQEKNSDQHTDAQECKKKLEKNCADDGLFFADSETYLLNQIQT